MYTTLISVDEAAEHLGDSRFAFVDCRHDIARPQTGRRKYLERHIPGAVYADLDVDLSGPVVPGVTGRHPLPDPQQFDAAMSRLGVDVQTQVVAYDEFSGALAASRLWWLLRWAGHQRVAVLDGGFRQWVAVGKPTATGEETRPHKGFTGRYDSSRYVDASGVMAALAAGRVVMDARAADRYRGENETVDPVAGHIPGAVSVPYQENLTDTGLFLTPQRLQDRLAGVDGEEPRIVYCGSGVSAAQMVLAHAHAALPEPLLYAGSWSEWITDPTRPIARGNGQADAP